MNISLISQLTISTIIASVLYVANISSASAFSLELSGTFDDGGTIGGTFDFDESVTPDGEYSNIDITTTDGSVLTTGSNYTDNAPDTIVIPSSNGFSIQVNNSDFFLDLHFESSLVGMSPSEVIQISTITREDDFAISQFRLIADGTLTQVPFEFNPTLGLFLVGSLWGISYLKKSSNQ